MCVNRVNVNTTYATTGATALLLPAQNTHTLHGARRPTTDTQWNPTTF
jgi:hypothetical protein